MPTRTDDLNNTYPGEVVVPLPEIFDLLASHLEDEKFEIHFEQNIHHRTIGSDLELRRFNHA